MMETIKKLGAVLSPVACTFKAKNYAICGDESFPGSVELCNLPALLVGRMGGLGLGPESFHGNHFMVLHG